jgi:hypothetical protein
MVLPHRFEELVDELDLSPFKKNVLKQRFVRLVTNEKQRSLRITLFYYFGHTVVSVGSLIVPALLSIQYTDSSTDPESFSYIIYWTTWFTSLFVTTFNALLTLFKIDKKYLYLNTNKELLASEGWQYLQLSGRYSGFFTPTERPTHENQFIFFCHRIEKIRLHEVEDEYSRFHEQNAASHNALTNNQSSQASPEKQSPTNLKSNPFRPPLPLPQQQNTVVRAEIDLSDREYDSVSTNELLNGSNMNEDLAITKKRKDKLDDVEETSQQKDGQMSVSIDMPK